eukprot:3373594-Heterocapsa_arctica.AAC.1
MEADKRADDNIDKPEHLEKPVTFTTKKENEDAGEHCDTASDELTQERLEQHLTTAADPPPAAAEVASMEADKRADDNIDKPEHLEKPVVAGEGASLEADNWADCNIDEPDTRWFGDNGKATVEFFDIASDELMQEHLEPHLPEDTDHSTNAQVPKEAHGDFTRKYLEPHLPDDKDHSTNTQVPKEEHENFMRKDSGHRKAKGKNKGKGGKD